MTKEEGKLFKERWHLVNDVIIDEIRRTPIAVKFQQLARLFGPSVPKNDDVIVRERWIRLKSPYHV